MDKYIIKKTKNKVPLHYSKIRGLTPDDHLVELDRKPISKELHGNIDQILMYSLNSLLNFEISR